MIICIISLFLALIVMACKMVAMQAEIEENERFIKTLISHELAIITALTAKHESAAELFERLNATGGDDDDARGNI